MKSIILALCLALALLLCAPAQAQTDTKDTQAIEQILESMSPYERVCQLFIVKPESIISAKHVTQAGPATRSAMAKYPVGGFIYFSSNVTSEKQITAMIDTVQAISQENVGAGLFIGVDEEGGTITRVAKKLPMTRFDTMAEIGARGDTQEAYQLGYILASELAPLGFNVDFAPVADVLIYEKNSEIGDRSFGRDANVVAQMVEAETRGLLEGGIAACLKHFPGMGSAVANSHLGTSTSSRTLEELRETEFLPFKAGIEAGARMVMVSHVTYTNIDPDSPASLSRTFVTELLREEFGFDGLIITDALRMQAISDHYASGRAAIAAVEAGVDLLLMPADAPAAIEGLYAAVQDGRIPQERIDESVRRILAYKQELGLLDIQTEGENE